MTSENWLTTTSGKFVDVAQNSTLLSSLIKISENIDKFRALNVEDALDVIQAFTAGQSEDLEQQLNEIGIESAVLEKLSRKFDRALDEQDLEEFQFLLTGFDNWVDASHGESVERIWPLFEGDEQEERSVGNDVKLELNAAFALSLVLQGMTEAKLPAGVAKDIVKPAVLRLAAKGALSLGAGASVARGVASAVVSARAAGSAEVDFFYRHVTNRFVGEALLTDMGRLDSPFSVKKLREGLHEKNLAAVKILAKHDASISGSVGFAQDLELADLVRGKVGATFGFSKSLSGEFEYLVYAHLDGNLAINVRRLKANQQEQTSSFGVSVDLTKWAEKMYPQIADQLDDLGDIIKDVNEFLPGRGEFQKLVGDELKSALDDFEYSDEVLQGLGLIEGAGLGDSLDMALLDRVESWPALWEGKANERATEITATLVNQLPVGTDVRNELAKKLEGALQKGLGNLDDKLDARLKELVKGASYKKFAAKLNKRGYRVSDSISRINDRVDAVTGPVRDALGQLQARLTKLKTLFNDASKAKVSLALTALSREENSDSLDLKVVLNPNHADAQDVLNELITADLDNLMRRIVETNGQLKDFSNGAIVSATGTFTRYAAMFNESGFTAVLFGHGLTGKTRIFADAKLAIDAHGNLNVLTRAEFKQQYKNFHDERELLIVDTVELAAARRMQAISLALNFSMSDEDLSPKEAATFLWSAEQAGLLAPGTAATASKHLDPKALKAGRLDIGMTLTRTQALQLLNIADTDKPKAKQPPIDEERILRVAGENVAQIIRQQPPSRNMLSNLATLSREFPRAGFDIGDDIETMIEGMTRKQWEKLDGKLHLILEGDQEIREHSRTLSWLRARHVAVKGCHGLCVSGTRRVDSVFNNPFLTEQPDIGEIDDVLNVGDTSNEQFGLLDALQGMRDVYFAEELARKWDVESLRSMQFDIGNAFKTWFAWQDDLKWWMFNTKQIRPLILALFKTIGELAQRPDATKPIWLSAALTLKGPNAENKKRIPLA